MRCVASRLRVATPEAGSALLPRDHSATLTPTLPRTWSVLCSTLATLTSAGLITTPISSCACAKRPRGGGSARRRGQSGLMPSADWASGAPRALPQPRRPRRGSSGRPAAQRARPGTLCCAGCVENAQPRQRPARTGGRLSGPHPAPRSLRDGLSQPGSRMRSTRESPRGASSTLTG